ncbi:MAG: ATP-binding protein [Pseudomonadota bacterium]
MKLRLSVIVFFAFALTSLTSVLALAIALSLSLESGFNDYLLSYENEQFDDLIERIEQLAQSPGEEAATLERFFPDLIAAHERGRQRGDRRQRRPDSVPIYSSRSRRPPEAFHLRLIGFDANGEHLFGPSPPPPDTAARRSMTRRDIVVDGRKIGSLMVLPLGPTPGGVNARFLEAQYRTGGLFIVLLLLLSLIPAWFAARNADRIVRGVKEATDDIVRGSYRKRAPDSSIKEVSEITSNINLLTEELQRLADLRRKWLAETSHELRTPLAAMTAEVDALAEGVRSYSHDAIVSLKEEASNLGRLVNDLHFLAVADLSAPSYNFTNLDPVALCRNIVDRFKARADNAGLTLEFEAETTKPLTVNWDKGRIEQVLSNILTNSLRYTEAPGKILVFMRETSSSVMLTFEDTPPGVGPEDLKQLFEPLFRVDATRDRATGGTGLGLSVAQTIVRMHHGSITASASDLGGLRLTVTLPKRPREA